MLDTPFGHRITFGGVTTAMVVGLVSQDVATNAEAEPGFESIRLLAPVLHGDTLYAYSEVLEKVDGRSTGTIRFRHHGVNQHGRLVFTGVRTLVMRRRPASHV
jgi:acyl dehydratase